MEEDFVNKSKIYPWYFAAGAIFIYTALSVIPGIIGIGYSFTDCSAFTQWIVPFTLRPSGLLPPRLSGS